jgi:16S rRNA (cytidine1402-2'-O)-methyltransferase
MNKGTLYVVGTPIGNLADITIRALETLKIVDLVIAEDTRKTGKLLMHYEIKKPMLSFHEHSRRCRIQEIFIRLNEGKNIALLCSAGTPAISDPGANLVKSAHEQGLKVIPIPGPSAISASASISGIRMNKFIFEGFAPRKRSRRKKLFLKLANQKKPMIFFESPHRIKKTLEDMCEVFGERNATVTRELTKIYEEIRTGTLGKLSEYFLNIDDIKGEFTIIIEGKRTQDVTGNR